MAEFLKSNLEIYFIENPNDVLRIAEQILINKEFCCCELPWRCLNIQAEADPCIYDCLPLHHISKICLRDRNIREYIQIRQPAYFRACPFLF